MFPGLLRVKGKALSGLWAHGLQISAWHIPATYCHVDIILFPQPRVDNKLHDPKYLIPWE